jgi:hypothetical protein
LKREDKEDVGREKNHWSNGVVEYWNNRNLDSLAAIGKTLKALGQINNRF